MQRILSLLACLTLALAASGCGMCHTPYDYSGPVLGPGNCPTCGFYDRAGSGVAAGPTPAATGQIPAGGSPAAASLQPRTATRTSSTAAVNVNETDSESVQPASATSRLR